MREKETGLWVLHTVNVSHYRAVVHLKYNDEEHMGLPVKVNFA